MRIHTDEYHTDKEAFMATVDTHPTERRHIPDRRSDNLTAHRTSTGSQLSAMDWTAMVLLIVGGINWGLIGFFGFNLVAAIFGEMSVLTRIVYALVGLAALYSVYTSTKMAGKT